MCVDLLLSRSITTTPRRRARSRFRDRSILWSGVKVGVPVEPATEIFPDIVGQEFQAGAQQLRRGWPARHLQRAQPAIRDEHALSATMISRLVLLRRVAVDAGGQNIFPDCRAAMG